MGDVYYMRQQSVENRRDATAEERLKTALWVIGKGLERGDLQASYDVLESLDLPNAIRADIEEAKDFIPTQRGSSPTARILSRPLMQGKRIR